MGTVTEVVGMGGVGYSVHRDRRGWGSVSVPTQTSSAHCIPGFKRSNTMIAILGSLLLALAGFIGNGWFFCMHLWPIPQPLLISISLTLTYSAMHGFLARAVVEWNRCCVVKFDSISYPTVCHETTAVEDSCDVKSSRPKSSRGQNLASASKIWPRPRSFGLKHLASAWPRSCCLIVISGIFRAKIV